MIEHRPIGNPEVPKSAFFFFLHLDERLTHPNLTLEIFTTFWRKIADHTFNSKELAIIAQKTAAHLKSSDNKTLVEDIKNFLTENITIWSDIATVQIQNKQFNSQNLNNSLWAFATLGIEPPEKFMSAWTQEAIKQINGEYDDPKKRFKSLDLSISLWAFATLGIEPPEEFMSAWTQEATAQILEGEFNTQDLTNTLWAIAVIHAMSGNSALESTARLLHEKIRALPDLENTSIPQKAQIAQSCLWFDLDSPVEMPKETEVFSTLETSLKTIFSNATLPVSDEDYTIKSMKHKVDMHIEYNGKTVLIEADGSAHFTKRTNPDTGKSETGRYNGSTLFQSKLTEKEMPEDAILLRMPAEIIKAISRCDTETQKTVILNFLDSAAILGSGEHTPDNAGSKVHAFMAKPTQERATRPVWEDIRHLDMPIAA